MFEMFFISTVFFKSSRVYLIVRKGKIICYIMRNLPQIHVIHPLPFGKTVLFSMDQCIYIFPEFWKCTGNLMPFIDKRWLTIRQDACRSPSTVMCHSFLILRIIICPLYLLQYNVPVKYVTSFSCFPPILSEMAFVL